jgi:peptide/nickel transport system ATP-binding protein
MSTPLLQVKGLGLSLPDMAHQSVFSTAPLKRIFSQISFDLQAGASLGVIGESGSGKSTLARALTMIMPPQEGELLFRGESVLAFNEQQRIRYRGQLQMVFQDPMSSLNPRRRICDIIAQPLQMMGRDLNASDRQDKVMRLLRRVGLDSSLALRYPHQLSGGQRQRVGIARALALQPVALIADEVTSGLDVSAQARIVALLQELRREEGLALIFISHDLSLVRSLCDDVLILRQGEVMEQGPSAQIFSQPRHAYTRDLMDAIALPVPDEGWLERGLTPADADA